MNICIVSDVGTVLKVVMIPRESWHDLEEVVLEEMTVFRVKKKRALTKTHSLTVKTHIASIYCGIIAAALCLFCAGAHPHHCHGAVHETGTGLFSHVIFNRVSLTGVHVEVKLKSKNSFGSPPQPHEKKQKLTYPMSPLKRQTLSHLCFTTTLRAAV